jgi:hypothetical protein
LRARNNSDRWMEQERTIDITRPNKGQLAGKDNQARISAWW